MKIQWAAMALLLSASSANAAILNVKSADVVDLTLQKNESLRCRSSHEEFAFELKMTLARGIFHRAFCADASDRSRWEGLYSQIVKLVSGMSSERCLLTETCNYWGCEKTYGKTKVDSHNIVIFTSPASRIEDYQVNLQIGCYP